MTRLEHLEWAKKRAIEEMNFTKNPKQGIVSMMSDLRKHPETNNETLLQLCLMQIMMNPQITRQEVINFLNGFN